MNAADFFTALIIWMNPKYPGLAAVLDARPEKWTASISRIRELCENRGIYDTDQFPYVVANLFPSAK